MTRACQLGFFNTCRARGLSKQAMYAMCKAAQEKIDYGDAFNSYGGYGLAGAAAGGLLGAIFNKKDRLRGALMGALAGGVGGAGLYGHNKAMDAAETRRVEDLSKLRAENTQATESMRRGYEDQLAQLRAAHGDELERITQELLDQSQMSAGLQAIVDRGNLTPADVSALLAVSAGYNGYPGGIDELSDEQLNDVRTLLGVLAAGAPWARGGDSFDPSGLMSYIDQVQDYRDIEELQRQLKELQAVQKSQSELLRQQGTPRGRGK